MREWVFNQASNGHYTGIRLRPISKVSPLASPEIGMYHSSPPVNHSKFNSMEKSRQGALMVVINSTSDNNEQTEDHNPAKLTLYSSLQKGK